MGQLFDLPENKKSFFNTRKSTEESVEIDSKTEVPEIIRTFWKTLEPGFINPNWSVHIEKPNTIVKFEENGEFDGFDGVSKIIGSSGIRIGTLWYETDGRTPIFYIVDGNFVGKMLAMPFSALQVFVSEKEFPDMVQHFSSMDTENGDENEILDSFFSNFFTKALTDE